ncbi:hypothetical protein CKO44_22500 [Rubrivivax gelatinosus]|uniref:Uncharacterized protein n=1 Tax=Rubrivivax gelatinosus TaxID=28068 RepID=A0ABS1DSX3_RUBGE|nr:hypothetical protein [Rubrivivax gelatinosus]MBK1616229.1 hypothetical protein [Rubrivivax gelatinosus]MBK1713091.1 hypothetical protein [Rubrivivax gelatinosus]MBZ8143921.1 hypothetical protein [Rubrivivax gelatinosus]
MSSIGSLATAYINPRTEVGAYERNAKAFGPVVATAIGAANAAGGVCDSTCSFSSGALSALDDWVDQGVDAVSSVGQTLAGAAQAVEDGVGDTYSDIKQALGSVVDTVEGAAQSVSETVVDAVDGVTDFVSDTASAVADAGGDVIDTVGDAFNTVAGYAAMGALSIGQAIHDVA